MLQQCDGNMLATSVMANALAECSHASGWEQTCRQFMQYIEHDSTAGAGRIIAAIGAAVNSLQQAKDPRSVAAVKAFEMLQHVQARRMLPLPLLQLLWDQLHPDQPCGVLDAVLDRLVGASLLYKQEQVTSYICLHSCLAQTRHLMQHAQQQGAICSTSSVTTHFFTCMYAQ